MTGAVILPMLPDMNAIHTLLIVAKAYGEAEGVRPETVSSRVFNDGKKLTHLRNGGKIWTDRFEAAMLWFSDNWPEGVDWPNGVLRPLPSRASEAA